MDTHISISTIKYEAVHGRKPRQPRAYRVSPWAFHIDLNPVPVFITASYKEALKQATAQAQYSVTVLP
jgi:hypothetical protein